MTDRDDHEQPQHERTQSENYPEQQQKTPPGRSFPLLAPVIVLVTALVIMVLFWALR